MTTATARNSNPFSTRWVRPGALPYLFIDGDSAGALLDRLRQSGWRGAIVGPHGSGKSTLLSTLIPEFEKIGIEIRHVQRHGGERRWSFESIRLANYGLLVIDGFEQLNWLHRRHVIRATRTANCGLLITVHAECTAGEIPVIHRTAGELCTLHRLVNCHLPDCNDLISAADVAAQFHAYHGNIRDALFALYDLFEFRSRTS